MCEGGGEGELGGICVYHPGKKPLLQQAAAGSEI